jgi:two-component system, sensor histidine kinase PdtaS
VASLVELARQHTDLAPVQVTHLQRLARAWNLLADLSFADILLFGKVRGTEDTFVILDQVRPTTGPTLYRHDRIGQIVSDDRPLLASAFATGDVIDGGLLFRKESPRIRVLDIPVRLDGELLGVLSRQFSPDMQRAPGDLEIAYFTACRRFDRMVAEGVFPFAERVDDDEMPRVGDGVIIIDPEHRIEFISPNARSTLVGLGHDGDLEGRTFAEIGVRTPGIDAGLAALTPGIDEVDAADDSIALAYCLPFVEARRLTGGLVLLRDVTDLRRRDRLLMSKDASIAEIHHRVKNNLQTISSLLRLQGRRLVEPAAKAAIDESVRRIQSIAVVHEILSQDPGNALPFTDILRTLVRLVDDGLVSPTHPVEFRVEGDAGHLRSEQSTQLAIVLTELMQNAVEHAFLATGIGRGVVTVTLANDGNEVRVSVIDDGKGAGPLATESSGLGMAIVTTLVESELDGCVRYGPAGGPPDRPGTRADITFPC